MHIRPLEAEILDIGATEPEHEKHRQEGAAWLKETDPARAMGFLEWVRSGNAASLFPGATGLDGLRYMRRNYGTSEASTVMSGETFPAKSLARSCVSQCRVFVVRPKTASLCFTACRTRTELGQSSK